MTPGVHRRPHPHGRADLLGPARHLFRAGTARRRPSWATAVSPSRRRAPRSVRWSCATSNAPKTSRPRRWPPASTGRGPPSANISTPSTRCPKGINYAANIGHSALRTYVMGERAFDRASTDADIAAMEHELRDALHAGAIGFTTSRSDQHETSDNRPVASRLASWDEVCRLVSVMTTSAPASSRLTSEPAGQSTRSRDSQGVLRSSMRDLAVSSRCADLVRRVTDDRRSSSIEMIDDVCRAAGACSACRTHAASRSSLSFKTRLAFDGSPNGKSSARCRSTSRKHLLRDDAVRARARPCRAPRQLRATDRRRGPQPDYDRMRVFDHPGAVQRERGRGRRQEGRRSGRADHRPGARVEHGTVLRPTVDPGTLPTTSSPSCVTRVR